MILETFRKMVDDKWYTVNDLPYILQHDINTTEGKMKMIVAILEASNGLKIFRFIDQKERVAMDDIRRLLATVTMFKNSLPIVSKNLQWIAEKLMTEIIFFKWDSSFDDTAFAKYYAWDIDFDEFMNQWEWKIKSFSITGSSWRVYESLNSWDVSRMKIAEMEDILTAYDWVHKKYYDIIMDPENNQIVLKTFKQKRWALLALLKTIVTNEFDTRLSDLL